MTLFIVILYYAIGYVPQDFSNKLDKVLINAIWSKFSFRPSAKWEPMLRHAVLSYSDQQIMTGIAILVSGYAQLKCGLPSHYWQIIVYLAWFSSLTHLTTLTFLRQFFRTNRTARVGRVTLMSLMLVGLTIALIPTGYVDWSVSNGSINSTICFFRKSESKTRQRFQITNYQSLAALLSIVVLLVSYITRLFKISKRATSLTESYLRTRVSICLKTSISNAVKSAEKTGTGRWWRAKALALEIIYVLLKAFYDVYQSLLWEVSNNRRKRECSLWTDWCGQILWLALALIWGTSRLVQTRIHEASYHSEMNVWSFGQILPVILLILPLLSIGQNYFGTSTHYPLTVTPSKDSAIDVPKFYFVNFIQHASVLSIEITHARRSNMLVKPHGQT